jgi:transposase
MKPYSNDLREKIIRAIQENDATQEEIAYRFSVSLSFVEKLWQRFRASGSFAALPHSGGRMRLLKSAESVIRSVVAAQPDITLLELSEQVAGQTNSPPVSVAVMCLELERLRLPRKKSRSTPQNGKLSEL